MMMMMMMMEMDSAAKGPFSREEKRVLAKVVCAHAQERVLLSADICWQGGFCYLS